MLSNQAQKIRSAPIISGYRYQVISFMEQMTQKAGRRVTAGCLRMYDEDVEFLYNKVSIKTKVTIISEPYLYAYKIISYT